METILDLPLTLLVVAVVLVASAFLAEWVFQPLERAAKRLNGPLQFTIADFLCLFFLIQLPMSLNHWALSTEGPFAWPIAFFISLVAGLAWWFGVRNLSRANVRNPWHRIAFLVVVYPFGLLGSLTLIALPFIIMARVIDGTPAAVFGWGTVIEIGVAAGTYACGRFTRWVVAKAAPAPR